MVVNASQRAEIVTLKEGDAKTFRPTVPALEALLYEPIPVLDHGFIRVIDYMGDDAAIVQAARVSYGKGTKQVNKDKGLINYLMRHRHTTPFEMCEIKFHIKMPIFVARQWIRHRTANVNEYSARYSVLDKEFYIPSPEHLAAQSDANHQGRGNKTLNHKEAVHVLEILKEDALRCYAHYEELMNLDADGNPLDEGRQGLARELARMNLPVNIYTQWYWKVDLHNLIHFLSLRADPHAQYEIRVYAEAMLDVVRQWVPITYDACMNYRMEGVSLSRDALNVVRKMLKGETVAQQDTMIGAREWQELMQVLGLK